jgi:menaquinone-dependent protoporphyrinogen oxidase
MTTTVLVAFASKHGSTKGIAQAIGGAMHSHGCRVRVMPAGNVRSVDDFDVVIIGSAIYHDHWLWEGSRLLRRVRKELAGKPTWLFSSGPIGGTIQGEALIADGCGGGVTAPAALLPALDGLVVLDHAMFAGRVDERAGGLLERGVPRGDWRNFRQVSDWGHMVGDEVASARRVRDVARVAQVAHAVQAVHAAQAAQTVHVAQGMRSAQGIQLAQGARFAQVARVAR